MILKESQLRLIVRGILVEVGISSLAAGGSGMLNKASLAIKDYVEVGGDDNDDFCGIMTSLIRLLASDDARVALKDGQYSDIYRSDTSLRNGIIKLSFDILSDTIKSLMAGIKVEKNNDGTLKISRGSTRGTGTSMASVVGQIDGTAGQAAKTYAKNKVVGKAKEFVKGQVKKKWFKKIISKTAKKGVASAVAGPVSTAISVAFLAACMNRLESVADEEVQRKVRLNSLVPDVKGASKGVKSWASGLNLPDPSDFTSNKRK